MANKPPAFQFYAKDWLSSKPVRRMTPEQRGYYIQLIAEAWDLDEPGTLPDDPEQLWFLAGAKNRESFDKVSALVLEQFPVVGGKRCNAKLCAERRKQKAYSRRQSDNAKKPRPSHGTATAKPPLDSGSALHLQSAPAVASAPHKPEANWEDFDDHTRMHIARCEVKDKAGRGVLEPWLKIVPGKLRPYVERVLAEENQA